MSGLRACSRPWMVGCLNLALGLTWAFAGRAGEPACPGVPLPGLESDPPQSVRPRSAAVTLRDDELTLDLAVSATADATELLLKGPRFGWMGATERYPERQFPELKIRLNGEVIAPRDRFEAMAGGNDVTSLLRAADMDPWAITRSPPLTAAHPTTPQVMNLLRNAGAIAKGGGADDASLYTAKWVARRLLAIPVAPAADARLQLEYKARPGIRPPGADDRMMSSFERLYCLPERELKRLQTTWDKSPVAINEYDIATGIDGNAPDTVTLSWSASMAASQRRPSMAFWCGPGGKSIARRGTAERERAAVDMAGILHVLTVAQ